MRVSDYTKFIVAAVVAVVVAVQTAVTDGGVTPTEAVQVVLAGLTALGVYALPNSDDGAGGV